jgi:hypothetical protein
MLTAPWRTGMAPSEITEGVGAYCSGCWWLDGGDLYNPADQETLSAVYAVIRRYLMAKVEPDALDAASRMLDLLLDEPVLIVQEDFAVYLSCDRRAPAGRELLDLGRELNGRLGEGALDDVVGTLCSWTGRWPPLTTFSRGPGDGVAGVPPGFDWVVGRFGGVRAVTGMPKLSRRISTPPWSRFTINSCTIRSAWRISMTSPRMPSASTAYIRTTRDACRLGHTPAAMMPRMVSCRFLIPERPGGSRSVTVGLGCGQASKGPWRSSSRRLTGGYLPSLPTRAPCALRSGRSRNGALRRPAVGSCWT